MPRCPICHRRLAAGSRCPADRGATADRSAVAEAPPEIPGYSLVEPIGHGGFARVWSGRRDGDGAEVAIKIAGGISAYSRACFEREAEILAALGAPDTPALIERGEVGDGIPWIAMELLSGLTLAGYLEGAPAPLDRDAVVTIAAAVAGNLEAVHRSGHVHGDLKPNNVMLVDPVPGATRLIDFGLEAGDPVEAVIAGSVEYIAPEKLGGAPSDPATDIYSFGVLLYELLTLRAPFAGDRAVIERGHLALSPPSPSELVPVPAELEALCLACLAKDPRRRPRSAAAITARLGRCSGSPLVDVRRSPRPSSPSGREPVVLLVADVEDASGLAEVTGRGGVIARQLGHRYVCAFTGGATDDPVHAALHSAEILAERGARVAIDLAELRVRRRGDDSVRLYGDDVDQPERWLPDDGWTGLLLGSRIAPISGASLRPSPAHPEFFELAPLPEAGDEPLIGRGEELAVARASLATSLATRTPGLLTITAAGGLGKSRMTRELESMCRELLGDGEVVVTSGERAALDLDSPSGDQLVLRAWERPLAIVVDDGHRLDDTLCDAIEYATLDAADTPLWIAVLASPRLVRRRPDWGARANRHQRIVLAPLDEASAMKLAAHLLRPADPPPAETLRRLASWSGGNPFFLVELVATLKRRGVVRQRSTGSYFVATTELEKLPAMPVGQWLAARRLEAMPIEVAALARLCSILGTEFSRDEVAWLQRASRDGPGPAVDVDVGLAELEQLHILARDAGDTWSFVEQPTADAIYKLIDAGERRRLHVAAMSFWEERAAGERALARFARHAAIADPAAGALAFLDLGDRARRTHRPVDADLHYTAALDCGGDDTELRAQALGGRGAVRYQMQRLGEAIADLEAATTLAGELGDRRRRARWLLELATVLDWADRYAESSDRVDEACALAADLGDPSLEARCVVGRGRARWREENIAEAIELLERGAAMAAECGDRETQIIALLLLPLALVFAGDRDRAGPRFDEVIELCEQSGDRFHLCAAYTNRMFLHRNAPDMAMGDLRRAKQLAREVGHLSIERVVSHNLAEILYWSGDDDESLALARRGFELQKRLMPEPVADDSLLLARIHSSRGEWSEVDDRLGWIRDRVRPGSLAPSDRVAIRMLELVSSAAREGRDDRARWDDLLVEAREVLAAEEFLEVLYHRARAARLAGEPCHGQGALNEAATRLDACAVWKNRFSKLATA